MYFTKFHFIHTPAALYGVMIALLCLMGEGPALGAAAAGAEGSGGQLFLWL